MKCRRKSAPLIGCITCIRLVPKGSCPTETKRFLLRELLLTRPSLLSGAIKAPDSLLEAAVAPFLSALGTPFVVSGVVSSTGFAAVWTVLKNLRELNAALNDEYPGSGSGQIPSGKGTGRSFRCEMTNPTGRSCGGPKEVRGGIQ